MAFHHDHFPPIEVVRKGEWLAQLAAEAQKLEVEIWDRFVSALG